jgi:hypothetical protein
LERLRAFLASISPLRIYREERERDREVLLAVVREASTVLQGATQVLLEQQRLMNQFLAGFKTPENEEPRSWTITPEQEVERVAQALGMTLDDYLKAI